MRILMLSPSIPYPPSTGGRSRTFHLLKGLSAHHEVTLLAGVNDECERDLALRLKDYCHSVHTATVRLTRRHFHEHAVGFFSLTPYYRAVMHSPTFQAQLTDLMDDARYDVVQVEHLAVAPFVASMQGAIKILDMHNVDSTYFQRLIPRMRLGVKQFLTLSDALKLAPYQRKLLPQFDRCIAVSDVDAEQLQRVVPRASIEVIPNGVDPDEFSPRDGCEEPNSMVFTARLSYFPNVDAMLFFCHEVLPFIRKAVPDSRLLIVGQQPPSEVTALKTLSGVEVIGSVPDTRPYLARAAVVIVPLRLGSGTRIKVLEAMAMAKAIVSTPVGAEGLNVRSGEDIEIGHNATELAEKVIELLHDANRRARLGWQARQTIIQQYTWAEISARLEAVYRRIRPRQRTAVASSADSRS